jgi:hypothetical protein
MQAMTREGASGHPSVNSVWPATSQELYIEVETKKKERK